MARRFSRRFVDDRSLGATQGMGAVFLGSKPDRLDPFINEAGILPCAHVSRWINPARECVIIHCPTASFQPCEKAGACVAHQLELNRSAGLLLDDHRASSDFRSYNEVADFDLDEVAAAQLTVDRQIEERSVSQTSFQIEKEAYRPYLSRFQRAFRLSGLHSMLGHRRR